MPEQPRFVFLDVDVDDSREKYKRACHFVETSSLKYGLSSSKLSELGGRERQTLPSLYESDVTQNGECLVEAPENVRIVIELFHEIAPLACENFAALCLGDRGNDKGSGVPLTYKNCRIHRVVKDFVIQGGDIVKGNGSGGASVFGKKFKDEAKGLKLKFDHEGLVGMGNSGKNSNSSQFFITLKACPSLNGKHVIFGRVVSGMDAVRSIESIAGPDPQVFISEAGFFDGRRRGFWKPASAHDHPLAPGTFVQRRPVVFLLGPPNATAKCLAISLLDVRPALDLDDLISQLRSFDSFLNGSSQDDYAPGLVDDGLRQTWLREYSVAGLLVTPAVDPEVRTAAFNLVRDVWPAVVAKPADALTKLRPLFPHHSWDI